MSNVYRNGKVHVLREMCETCIFRPGNKMHLNRGRVREMLAHCLTNESVIPCHSTLHSGAEAICRGFYDHPQPNPQALQLAERLGHIEEVDPPTPEETNDAT